MQRFMLAALAVAIAVPFAIAYAADEPAQPNAEPKPKAAETDAEAPAEPAEPQTAPDIDTMTERVSYLIGMQMGGQLARQGLEAGDLDLSMLQRGMKDALGGADPAVTRPDGMAAFEQFQKEMTAKVTERQKKQQAEAAKKRAEIDPEFAAALKKNTDEADKFLAENKAKEGVKTTASGLQYKVIEPGKGATPTAEDVVTVHYTGTLLDGTEFDSSVKRGQPAQFPVGGVIAGWTEALQLMKEGAKYRLWIPGDIAYGPMGRQGSEIGPNQLLVFDVELIKVNKETGGIPGQ